MRSSSTSDKKSSAGPALFTRLYVCQSGPRRGNAQLEAAFRTRSEAVAFLANVHGLRSEELKTLAREGRLQLNLRVHGSEVCAIRPVEMTPGDAERALSGELYL